MQEKHAKLLVEMADGAELELKLRPEYRRVMHGESTTALIGDFNSLLACVALAARAMDEDDFEDFVVSMMSVRSDTVLSYTNMGRDSEVFF